MEIRRVAVCRDCLSALRQPHLTSRVPSVAQQWHGKTFATAPTPYRARPVPVSPKQATQLRQLSTESRRPPPPRTEKSPANLQAIHSRVQELSSSVLKPTDGPIPPEQRVLYVLEQLESLAQRVLDDVHSEEQQNKRPAQGKQQQTATSALLGSVNARQYPAFISQASVLNIISEKAEEIVRHQNVFLTAGILKAYVQLQSLLNRPSSFPDIFDLYAKKPAPRQKGDGVEYAPANPTKISAAIDSKTANAALEAAIESHSLPLAIDVITTSFSAPAFKRAKILRQAAIPISGLAVAPAAAYALSTTFSDYQQSMDAGTATGVAFAGIMTYVGAVSMVGYVAVTTANDQMDRVTWATGVPLWERWIREEERAAIDKVAGAWGFKDAAKRGDEEGADWDSLREWIGVRGMVLDRVSLMEGME
ncbi:hypothetical protein M409DRAFT_63739 [Zasmidium cellare ATCC 36951]|uniref:Uncharacterized protein n=1 Tax=Zasmidium cellare ATCC 36951 TaxID=1080233 RepID=A0A6A6D015_ZASCE|nr:uncharacterized protein M409DRAFT_63739 [Zasmidium cellare ATCC 36951]KAF2171492.1 hypothetical protein M409DRAFT_63739 [Zasmidium cellare ATCC 36951]